MFRALNLGATLEGAIEALHSVSRSTAPLDIPLGSGPPQPTRAFVVALRDAAPGRFRVYVYLGRAATSGSLPSGLLFASDPPTVTAERLVALLAEAAEICAAQGFELETIAIAELDPEALNTLVADLPFPRRPPPAPPLPPRTSSRSVDGPGGIHAADTPTIPMVAVTETGVRTASTTEPPAHGGPRPEPATTRTRATQTLASILSLF